jgi:hypothetical protein
MTISLLHVPMLLARTSDWEPAAFPEVLEKYQDHQRK